MVLEENGKLIQNRIVITGLLVLCSFKKQLRYLLLHGLLNSEFLQLIFTGIYLLYDVLVSAV